MCLQCPVHLLQSTYLCRQGRHLASQPLKGADEPVVWKTATAARRDLEDLAAPRAERLDARGGLTTQRLETGEAERVRARQTLGVRHLVVTLRAPCTHVIFHVTHRLHRTVPRSAIVRATRTLSGVHTAHDIEPDVYQI